MILVIGVLASLFIVIFVVEILIMLLLEWTLIGSLSIWLPMLLDALLVSLAVIFTLHILIKQRKVSLFFKGRGSLIQIKIGLIVFLTELLLMLFFEFFPVVLNVWLVALLDSVLLGILAVTGIYYLVLKPVCASQSSDDLSGLNFDPTVITNVLVFLSIGFILLMFLLLNYQNQVEHLKHDSILQEQADQRIIGQEFTQKIVNHSKDVLILSQQDKAFNYLLDPHTENDEALQNEYLVRLRYRAHIEQLRLLDASGQEVVRIERDKQGMPIVIKGHQLQDKSHRYYFTRVLDAPKDDVYISPLDLNKEFGRIEIPFKPMIRIAAPVSRGDSLLGVVVMNINASSFLEAIRRDTEVDRVSRQFLDQNGFWLFGNDEEKLWGFMFQERAAYSFVQQRPEVWQGLSQQSATVIDESKGSHITRRIELDPISDTVGGELKSLVAKPHWYLIRYLPETEIAQQLSGTKRAMLFSYVLIMFLLALATYLVTRIMLQKNKAQKRMIEMAYHDGLTGLKNRKFFHWKLSQQIKRARKNQSQLSIMILDLNQFKPINDELGHEVGDLVLQTVANLLKSCFRSDDTVARIGGDEFAAILNQYEHLDELEVISKRIVSSFSNALAVGGMKFDVGISIGIAVLNDYEEPVRSLISRADLAMYESRENEEVNYIFAQDYL